jgi:cytochrome c biogenesis protein CcmG, thiol:disulfide interchange protein DsbE
MADALDHHDVDGVDAVGFDELEDTPRPRRTAVWVALGVGVVLALLLVALARTEGGSNDTARSSLLGAPAPLVQTTTIEGAPFDLATRRGSWVVVNFFATWCPPCRQEHPELVRFHAGQSQRQDGAELVTIVNNDDPARVAAWFEENGGGWPVLTDQGGRIYVSFGVAKVPETWIIDPNGIVRGRIISLVTAEGLADVLNRLKQGESL